jgi:hypothetical protein
MKARRHLAALAALTVCGLGLTYTESPATAAPCASCGILIKPTCAFYADFVIDTTVSTDGVPVLSNFLVRTPDRTAVASGGGFGGPTEASLKAWYNPRNNLPVFSGLSLDIILGTRNAWGYNRSVTRVSLDLTQANATFNIPVAGETPGTITNVYVTFTPNQVSPRRFRCY